MKKLSKIKIIFLPILFLGLFGWAESSRAACTGSSPTRTAASASLTDVAACVTAASSGDTINVPAGSETWSSQLSITKGLTLQGAGVGSTIISVSTGSSAAINYTPANPSLNEAFRLTGFEFNLNNSSAGLSMSNNNTTNIVTNVRIDHNKWTNTIYSQQWHWYGAIYGVFDHNTVDGSAIITPYGNNEYSWTNFSYNFGTNQVMFFENNTFNRSNTDWYILETGLGGRWVFRFNTVNTVRSSQPLLDAHGNQGAGSNLSNMAAEIYGNTINNSGGGGLFYGQRGGKSVVFNNTFTGAGMVLIVREEVADSITPPAFGPTGQPQHVSNSYYFSNYYGASRVNTGEPACCAAADGNMRGDLINENVDYFNQAMPFSGAAGIGVGTFASRPTTCTTGVGYWATDQGSWNTIGSGGQGVLYKCTSTNTWTSFYTPYTYPHPLTLSGSDTTSPASPTGLSVN